MDATGAGTSTGQGAAPADVTGSAGDVTAGPSRPVGRADVTGPLPVQAPADPTGPLPTPQAGSWFGGGEETAAQPVVAPAAPTASPPSWFATGPLPVVPAGPAPDVAPPPAEAAAPAALFDASHPGPGPSTPPTGLFEPANGLPPTAETGPQTAVPAPPPPAAVTPPAAGLPVQPVPAPPTDLFTPATPPSGAGAPAAAGATPDPVPVPSAALFTPTGPAPAVAEPPTELFAAVAPPPAAPQPPGPAGAHVHHAAATGPIPQVSPPAAAPSDVAPAPTAGPPPPPPLDAPARTDAWAFDREPPPPPRPDSPPLPADDRRRGSTQSRPLPAPTGGGHSPALITALGSSAATRQAKRRAWPLTVVGVLVAVAAGIALVFSVARTNPADLATSAATEAGSWPGARYQGAVAANDGGEIRFDLTVTAEGASGALSRDGGRATAELLWDQAGALIRANREWWLYHHPTRADDLAGVWVAEPLTETQEIDPVLRLSGPALSAFVRGEEPARWQALEQQLVEGRAGIVLFDGARRVVVGSEDAHPLLALDVAPDPKTPPVPISRPTDEEIAAVAGAAARVRQEAAPKTLAQVLQERPNVGIQLQPDPLCTAQTCNVTITVTNSGTAPARGRLEVSADGKVVANHPLDVHPGQVATFTAAAPNPQFGRSGATGRILWESRAVDD